jgi:hypothetical protein
MSVQPEVNQRLSTFALATAMFVLTGDADSQAASKSAPLSFARDVRPVLATYCFSCHSPERKKGDLVLSTFNYGAADSPAKDRKTWDHVLTNLRNGEMPPQGKPQPSLAERERVMRWIEQAVFLVDCNNPDPGRVTVRRLNRAEYNNTIRDLVGVDFQPAADFPADDSGYGFDNIGDALSLPPLLMEKYLAAAEKILDRAIVTKPGVELTRRYPADAVDVGYNARRRGDGWVALTSVEEDDVAVDHWVQVAGEYVFRALAASRQDTNVPVRMSLMLDRAVLGQFEVAQGTDFAKSYEVTVPLPAGRNRLRAVMLRDKTGLTAVEAAKWKTGQNQKGTLFVRHLEVAGPTGGKGELPASHTRLFAPGAGLADRAAAARAVVQDFMRRAYRRPVADAEVSRVMRFADTALKAGDTVETAVKLALQAVLVSPHFLFRGELQPEPDNPRSVHPVNEFALASRLSYFLWSSMPDDALLAEAQRGTLRRNLDAQVRRMLRDPKSAALVENFAGQWLQLRNLRLAMPDAQTFPAWNDSLRGAMQRETELFFEHIVREDRSVLEFLTADYTFNNEQLARHYGIPGVTGDAFQKVSLKGTPRAGVLTHGSILTLTSNPTRTSPVKRGKWILENILATPPPPPLPDVPELKEGKELTGTLRQRMEQHRDNPACASCHARMDPIGFGFENFDGIGAWRTTDGGSPVDSSGRLVAGEGFKGPSELVAILSRKRRDDFTRCLAEKLLTYALGRGLDHPDRCAVDQITKGLVKGEFKFSALVLEITRSVPFQMRRGEGDRTATGP